MIKAQSYVLKKYLDKSSGDYKRKYLSFLFPEEVQNLNKIHHFDPDLQNKTTFSNELFSFLHYSYIAEILKEFPSTEILYFLQLFPKDISEKISSLLRVNYKKKNLSPFVDEYFKNQLIKAILRKNPFFLPPSYLEQSNLNFLIEFSKEELCLLIDYLGLYDLAQILKKTLDAKILKKVESFLPEEKKEFLEKIGYPLEPFLPHMSLDNWSGKSFDLSKKIHKAGLVRLSQALSYESSLLIWYITHKLDTGRKDLIEECLQKQETFLNAKFVMKQIHFVIQTKFKKTK
jgi:hypothetical protein